MVLPAHGPPVSTTLYTGKRRAASAAMELSENRDAERRDIPTYRAIAPRFLIHGQRMASSDLPAYVPATLFIAVRSAERDVAPQRAAVRPPSRWATLRARTLRSTRVRAHARRAAFGVGYLVAAAAVFAVGLLGSYLIAAKSTGMALGIMLGAIFPLWVAVCCGAERFEEGACVVVGVAGIVAVGIMIPAGESELGPKRGLRLR